MPALQIPGVETYHSRESWQDPLKPITGLLAVWSLVTTLIAHYTADDDLIDGDPGERAEDLPAYMRAMQASYLRSRGYSLGYLFAIDWLGGVWEIRGFEFRSAANVGDIRKTGVKNFNIYSGPILFLVDGNDRLTPEAAASARAVYAEMERRANRELGRPKPHSDVDFTSCCGDGIRLDISQGLLDPFTAPAPIPTPPLGVPDMFFPITPFRNSDTRKYGGFGLGAGDHRFVLGAPVPANATAVALNITIINPSGDGYGVIWPKGAKPADTSFVNFKSGPGNTNAAVVVGTDGLGGFMLSLSKVAHVLVDVTGYWTA